jgi:8-oxo-dGTP pyrophosphatase MutT (NUDIX family)
MHDDKFFIAAAMNLSGYDQWRPNFDVPHLHRPRSRPAELPGRGKFAAVLLMLFKPDEHDDTRIVLTRRRRDMSKHPGQISLPGGRQDKNESLLDTALRESSEEIGIDPDNVEVLGQLNAVYIPPSDFTVTPFVGWHLGVPQLNPAEYEVAEILQVPIKQLLDPSTLVHGAVETWNKQDPASPRKVDVPYYALGPHQVWGATAIMLDEFIDRLRRLSANRG